MKVLLIGSTGMIGKAIAEELQAQGHEVMGVSRKSTPGVDISQPEDIKKFFDKEIKEPVDAIVCTGGGAHIGAPLENITDEQIYEGINSKMMGQVNLVRFGISKVKQQGGTILLTGGLMGFKGGLFPNVSQVGMVNAGLNGFVLNVASDWKDKGVRINVIHPPFIRETAELYGMPSEGLPTKAECAKYYVECLSKDESGKGFFLTGLSPEDC